MSLACFQGWGTTFNCRNFGAGRIALTGRRWKKGVTRTRSQRPEVYVMKKPLVGWEALERAMGPLYPQELALHCMVVVQESSNQMWLCDFLPVDPLNPETTVKLLSGGRAQGEVRQLKLSTQPNYRKWYVGQTLMADPAFAVSKFNEQWDPMLSLLRHDCRSYTTDLVEQLTGKENILADLGI